MIDLKFLSKGSFLENNKNNIINECKGFLTKCTSDADIIKILLEMFKNDNWSLISHQEENFLKSKSKKLWVDYLIYRYKFKNYNKNGIIPDFPLYLLVEPTSICNLRCSMCFQIDKTFSS